MKDKVRGIHIDSSRQEVREVWLTDDTDGVALTSEVHSLCGGHFSAPIRLPNGDVVYVFDDTSVPRYGFRFLGGTQSYYPGCAVVLGTRGSTEVDAKSTVAHIASRVFFVVDLTVEELL